ncbi:MAG: hypothetical protein NZM03_10240, partial [Limisphaera sp.]|nr:hypothetical protein [Limisphaera sp.]
MSGLTAAVVRHPPNIQVNLTLQTNYLAGRATIALGYGVSALDARYTWGYVEIRITSAEGVSFDLPLRVDIDPLVPRLVAYPGRLDGGMKRGAARTVSFQVVNEGGLETGPLSVSMPPVPWMRVLSPNPMPSLL